MASKTRLTTFERLDNKGELGVVLGRLMLAMNDIGIANEGLGYWMKEQEGIKKDRQMGAKMYYIRMLISHIFEALTVVNKINDTPELKKFVERSIPGIRAEFAKCVAVIGTKRYKQMKDLRNGFGFHYLGGPVQNAIASQAVKAPDVQLSLSVGSDPLDWYYQPGDRIIDSAVVRGVFEVPEGADVQEEVTRLIHDLQQVGDHLAQFAGYFIMEHAT
jgi:hypothetical protein